MIVVHHLNNSRSQRILWLLEELRLPYEIDFYERVKETNAAPAELKSVHPLGRAPIIVDNGRVVAESAAIIDYIIRHYGGVGCSPPRWIQHMMTMFSGSITPRALQSFRSYLK